MKYWVKWISFELIIVSEILKSIELQGFNRFRISNLDSRINKNKKIFIFIWFVSQTILHLQL